MNAIYQERDGSVIDYCLYRIHEGGPWLRGPKPSSLEPSTYFVTIGAAQTFGCFVEFPYAHWLSAALGIPHVNLGYGGAGPRYFADNELLHEVIANAAFAVVQVMSARSEDNRLFISRGLERLRRRSDDELIGAELAYKEVLATLSTADIWEVIDETRRNWVESYRRLAQYLPKRSVLFWFSRRSPNYAATLDSTDSLFGAFPQLVDEAMIRDISTLFPRLTEAISSRGLPQPLFDRSTGATATITGHAYLGSRPYPVNTYYPSPEMHIDAFRSLMPMVADWASRVTQK